MGKFRLGDRDRVHDVAVAASREILGFLDGGDRDGTERAGGGDFSDIERLQGLQMGPKPDAELGTPFPHRVRVVPKAVHVEQQGRRLKALEGLDRRLVDVGLHWAAHTRSSSGRRVSDTITGRALSEVKLSPARLCQNTGIPTPVAPGTSAEEPATNSVRAGLVPSFFRTAR